MFHENLKHNFLQETRVNSTAIKNSWHSRRPWDGGGGGE